MERVRYARNVSMFNVQGTGITSITYYGFVRSTLELGQKINEIIGKRLRIHFN